MLQNFHAHRLATGEYRVGVRVCIIYMCVCTHGVLVAVLMCMCVCVCAALPEHDALVRESLRLNNNKYVNAPEHVNPV